MDDLKAFLNQSHTLGNTCLEDYLQYWSPVQVPRKTILTEAGKTERFLYFVREGVQKSYFLNEGKEHVMFFAYPPSFSGVMESFFTQTPSRYYLETLSDSKFYRLPYTQHQELIEKHRELETLFRKTTEGFLSGIIQRYHELLTFDAETRLRTFLKRSPHLLQLVSQKDLAS